MFEFDWDPSKAARNQYKHGIDFELATTVFRDPLTASIPDESHSDAEERWITVGQARNGQCLVICHTYWDTGKEVLIRLISARLATRNERRQYESKL